MGENLPEVLVLVAYYFVISIPKIIRCRLDEYQIIDRRQKQDHSENSEVGF